MSLDQLRGDLEGARKASLDAQAALLRAKADLARILSSGEGDLALANAAVSAAENAADSARDHVELRKAALHGKIAEAVKGIAETSVASAAFPVALLPVGIETRFSGDTLLIRVIPDQIHVEEHEVELSEAEVEAGEAFWRAVWRGGTADPAATEAERAAWIVLARGVGSSRRAAWIAEQTTPIGGDRPTAALTDDQPMTDPVFPEPPMRPSTWSRAALARTLPDQFIAIAYRRTGSGGTVSWSEIGRATGGPIDDAVQMGLDPLGPKPEVTDTGPSLPEGMRWIIDPKAAEDAGLLLRLNLPPGTQSIDRLVVLGTLSTLDPEASSKRLAELLSGHHYSDGLEVLRIGTPTNNSAAEASGFAGRDDPVGSFEVERRTPTPPDGSDGGLLARAFGISAETLRGVAHSGDTEQIAAGRMNALVWPASYGYWFDTLVQPGPSDAVIADIRRHALTMVRARGPLPPLRVGRQPYGILPVTSLTHWTPTTEPPGVTQLVPFLRSALPWWLDGADLAPRVRAGEDPDHGVLDVLSQLPVSVSVAVRSMVGANVCFVPYGVSIGGGSALADEASRQRWLAFIALKALGVSGLPYIGQLVAHADPTPILHLPYTVDPILKPPERAAAWQAIIAYLDALRGRASQDFRAEDPRTLTSVLTMIARRSVMLERVRAGVRDSKGIIAGSLVEAHLRSDAAPLVSEALISTTATLKIGESLSAPAAILAGSVQQPDGSHVEMSAYIDRQLVINGIIEPMRHADYGETIQAAEEAAKLDPDRAALLLGEALDIASHRIDAWITSLATRRLSDLRTAQTTGITLGAYGAVEDLLRSAPRTQVSTPPADAPAPLFADDFKAGYVHAPSLAQVGTAAVLRSGHLSHAARDPNAGALAIDLSSARVRTALRLLDGVREGQSLGALLGYQLERRLHELEAHTAVEAVRMLAPPPVVTEEPTPESLPPRAVCDGLALSRMERSKVLSATNANGAPEAAVVSALNDLGAAVDALADLLMAESVHNIVTGNPDRAAAALEALNHGEGAIPEPSVVHTPRGGNRLTHRLMIAIGPDAPPAPGWPTDGVRATAEPHLAAWVGHLLGNPTGLQVRLTQANAAPLIFPLADLQVGALDLVYEPLERRALRHGRTLGAAADATFDPDETLRGMLVIAAEIHSVLSSARPGTGYDLLRPQDRSGVVDGPSPADGVAPAAVPTNIDGDSRRTRLDEARARLQSAIDKLPELAPGDPAPEEDPIVGALNVLGAFDLCPGTDSRRAVDTAGLIAVRAAAQGRLAASKAVPDDAAILFGAGFPVLGLVAPPYPELVNAALAIDPLAASSPDALVALGGPAHALQTWIETMGRVRPATGRLADLLLAARLRSAAKAANLQAMQLPIEPFPNADPARRGQWVGLSFPPPVDSNNAALGDEPVTNFVLHRLGSVGPASGVALLVVDEFTEIVPSLETTTGLAFGFNAPGARPPQSILLAVPPVVGHDWSVDMLAQVVGETLDLARARVVDLTSVAWAGRFLPALYLTDGDIENGLDLPMKDIVAQAARDFPTLMDNPQ